MFELSALNREEALRYMGAKNIVTDEKMNKLFDSCESQLLSSIKVKYLYKEILLPNPVFLQGNAIKNHLKNCQRAIILCITLGSEVDRLIRTMQITDMAAAVIIDSLASVAIEQAGNLFDEMIAQMYSDYNLTFRFSPGYSDYPLELQSEFINLLDAPRKIGLCVNNSLLLTPTKSITAIMGLSKEKIEKAKTGCASCNLKGTCKFRKVGTRCGV